MGKKLTIEELEKKCEYHAKRAYYYERKIEVALAKAQRIGFKWYD